MHLVIKYLIIIIIDMSRINSTWHDCTETNDDECNLKIDSENMILLQNDEDLKKQ